MSRLLFVDDDHRILDALEAAFALEHDVRLATSADEALAQLDELGDAIDVIVSDLRMPRVDGAELVRQVRATWPEVVRILLTGHADLEVAVRAINEGHVFRLLTKPCPTERLREAVDAGIEQRRLRRAERELLEDTLAGTTRVLSEVLGLAAPAAFGEAERVRHLVGHAVEALGLPDAWVYDVAAQLAPIGAIALPPELLERAARGRHLGTREREMLADHPRVGGELLARVPRLGPVARMVAAQAAPPAGRAPLVVPPDGAEARVALGGALLRLATDVVRRMERGELFASALDRLADAHPPELIAALRSYRPSEVAGRGAELRVRELRAGMVLEADLLATNGAVLMRKGRALTGVTLARIRNVALGVGVAEPVRVRVPRTVAQPS